MTKKRDVACPYCEKLFAERGDVYNHIKGKHKGRSRKAFKPEREQSLGEELAEALISGERPEHLVMMFPEAFEDAEGDRG